MNAIRNSLLSLAIICMGAILWGSSIIYPLFYVQAQGDWWQFFMNFIVPMAPYFLFFLLMAYAMLRRKYRTLWLMPIFAVIIVFNEGKQLMLSLQQGVHLISPLEVSAFLNAAASCLFALIGIIGLIVAYRGGYLHRS